MKFRSISRFLILFCFFAVLLTLSTPSFSTPTKKARLYTRPVEFDYFSWDINAFITKIGQSGMNAWQQLNDIQQHQLVMHYLDLTYQLEVLQARIQQIYADPTIKDPDVAARVELEQQAVLQTRIVSLTPLAESVLQGQVTQILVEDGIARLGGAVPPLMFHTTPLPKALIASPRDRIQQDVNVSLLADLTLEQIEALEDQVEQATGESVLVVNVGGIGIYPTMVMRSSNLPWIIDTIAHEWTHNYLTLRPLGLNYDTSPELRTMNETAAALAGGEISARVLAHYYPEYVSMLDDGQKLASLNLPDEIFDFRAEMHTTRVKVDELLAAGKITEAEQYMEDRRILFVSHGFEIRKLNQAYFAFYGAYADSPGGAAGEDPVGPAVRKLREQSASLADFLRTIGKMNSFEDLQYAIKK
ncbi:MAG: hypothetical protein CVU42_05235 [Chloroflexi bacterium HGW-Chloroflexi-4]|jgi:hypothetical protein|nr:MAG: hypothetical protein CVU42_05235 [Chloroflexi bacterium HGW-Chloroflexi-4]